MIRTIEEYLALPYMVVVTKDPTPQHKGLVAWVVELPGCFTEADTYAELGELIEAAMRAWIETAIRQGKPIPEPNHIFA